MPKKSFKNHKSLFLLLIVFTSIILFGAGFLTAKTYYEQQTDAAAELSPSAGAVTPETVPTTPAAPTVTQALTPTTAPTATPKPTSTPVPIPTATFTPVPTTTPVPTATVTPVPTTPAAPTATQTLTPTTAPTATPKPTSTPAPTATSKPTSTPTPTVSVTNGSSASDDFRVSVRGQLQVIGTQLCDASGTPVTLRGISSAGIAWFPDFATKAFMQTFRDEWNISVFRIAMYSYEGQNSYVNNPDWNKKKVCELIDAAIELDLYVIVDWHILADGNPQTYQSQAIEFFTYISEKYAKVPNLLYEICNEPNGGISWSGNVKPYAEAVIPVIRKSSPDAIILVGSPTWSQDVDAAANDPLDFENIMYSLHFYAGTHKEWLRSKALTAMNKGLALFVTEWGTTDASGDGNVDTASSDEWLAFLEKHNISWCNWSLCNKSEASALLLPSAGTSGALPDSILSISGKYVKKKLLEYTGTPTIPAPTTAPAGSPTPTAAPAQTPVPTTTPVAAPSDGSVQLLAYNESRETITNTISPRIQITNHSSDTISLSGLEIRYYYTPESSVTQNLWCDYADINGSSYLAVTDLISGSYDAAASCMIIRFSSGSLPAGDTLSMQLRITNEDWSNYDQSNDASFSPDASTYTENTSIALLLP